MKLQQSLVLAAVQQNNANLLTLATLLTEEECKSRQLTKETLGAIRRLTPKVGSSPKLSKVLLGLGLPQGVVSLLLAAPNAAALPRVSSELEDLLEQGDSIHFESCQRTGDSLRVVDREEKYLGNSLWLFVIGKRKSLDGQGFTARAKLRLMTYDQEGLLPAGFYLERPYGQYASLLAHIDVLREWVNKWCKEKGLSPLPILIAPVWQREDGAGADFQTHYGGRYPVSLYCPSAGGGYMDTLTWGAGAGYDFFEELELPETIPSREDAEAYKGFLRKGLLRAYQERPFNGVYMCSLNEYVWNPQTLGFQHPPLERAWRGTVTESHRKGLKALISYLGYPTKGRCDFTISSLYFMYKQNHDTAWLLFPDDGSMHMDDGENWVHIIQDNVVVNDYPELGFFKPLDIHCHRLISRAMAILGLVMPIIEGSAFWHGNYLFNYSENELKVRDGSALCLFKLKEGYLEVLRNRRKDGFLKAVKIPVPVPILEVDDPDEDEDEVEF